MSRASNLAGFTTSISAEGADLNVGIVTALSIISRDSYSFQSVQGTQAQFTGLLISGISTLSGDVSIGGTLTYEDVTNVDSVGIITAQSGVEVGPKTGIGVTLNANGSAKFAGRVDVGNYVGTVNRDAGVTIRNTGLIQASRPVGTDSVFLGYTEGTQNSTSSIQANGSATFTGAVESTSFFKVTNTGIAYLQPNTVTAFQAYESSGPATINLNNNGSADFAGGDLEITNSGQSFGRSFTANIPSVTSFTAYADNANSSKIAYNVYNTDTTSNSVEIFANGNATFDGTVTASNITATFSGNGSNITNLSAANLTGTLPALDGSNLTNLPISGALGNYHNSSLYTFDGSGNFGLSGTVDGRNVATDGTKLDGIETNATADQTASEILAALVTVDGPGSGLNADKLDGVNGSNFLRSNTDDSFSGALTGAGTISLTGTTIECGRGSGSVALTTNDGYGNANVAFNHTDGIPEQAGSSCRIETAVDNNTGFFLFEIGNSVTASQETALTEVLKLTTSSIEAQSGVTFTGDGSGLTNIDSLASSVNNVTHTSDGQYDITLFGTKDGAAQSGGFSSKLVLKGGGGQTRTFELFQDYDGYATINTSWGSNYLDITSFNRVRFNQKAYLGSTGLWNDSGEILNLGGQPATSYLRSDADDTASGTITFNGPVNIRGDIDLADNDILRLGTGDDAELFCTGSHLYLDLNSGIGNFIIRDGTTTRYTFNDNGNFTATGNVIAYSDIKLKDNIKPIDDPLDKVNQINGVTFDRIDTPELGRQMGVIAQDVEKVCPELVDTDDEGTKSVAYGNMVGLLIEAIKDQQKQIDELKAQLEKK